MKALAMLNEADKIWLMATITYVVVTAAALWVVSRNKPPNGHA